MEIGHSPILSLIPISALINNYAASVDSDSGVNGNFFDFAPTG